MMEKSRLNSSSHDVRILAEWLDSKFRLPLGIRIGFDGILGFIPGIGDLVTNVASIYIIARAAMLGCPPTVLVRMAFNVFIDNLIDTIPILGSFIDVFWRSNTKNVALLNQYLLQPDRVRRSSLIFVAGLILILTLTTVATVAFAIWLSYKLVQSIGL